MAQLPHVYWIGGGSGAGKSVISRQLAADHGLRLYRTDDTMAEHARRITAEDAPLLTEFQAMDMDQRWVNRSPEVMLDTFHWFRGEGFGLIVEDLARFPRRPSVIAEGFRLLPHLVRPLLATPRHAVWLLPTAEFRRAAFERRGELWRIAGRTSNPERALRNLLTRDDMFTDRIREQATSLGLGVIEVGALGTVTKVAGQVADAFGL